MSKKFKIGLIQMNATPDISENRAFIQEYVNKAVSAGAKLVILPEHSDAIGANEKDFACEIPGDVSRFYAELAEEHNIYLHCGSITEKCTGQKPFNTSLLFGPNAEQLAIYRKLHLFDVAVKNGPNINESDNISAGDFISVVDTPLCRIGLSICYDLRFGEIYRLMALSGAELLIVSANFTAKTGAAHWMPLLRARAIENGCYVAAVDQCGPKPDFDSYGHTTLIDPTGTIISELADEPGLIIADIDPDKVRDARSQIPVLSNRRDDIYALHSDDIKFFK